MRLPVAIVGRAWRTPLGHTVDDVTSRLLSGERAAIVNPRAGYACSLVAPIQHEPARSRHSRFLRRMGLYGMEVASEALAASRLAGGPRTGCFAGVGGLRAHWDDMMRALQDQREDGVEAWDRGLRDVHPYWMLRHLSNNVHALCSAELDLRGEGVTFGGGSAGAQAISSAARALWDGAIDVAVVVAYDSLLEPETLVELGARRAATQGMFAQLAPAYDARATGFVPGEAAAALVLVRAADAGGTAIATVDALDAGDGERSEPDVATLGRLAASLGEDVGCVDGAARAWTELDAAERAMLGAHVAPTTPLSAITAALGQLGAASAVVQTIALAELLRRGQLPPIAGLGRAAPGPLQPLAVATTTTARAALGLSTGAPGLAAGVRVEVTR